MTDATWTILAGDCIERMQEMEPDSVDAVVTDPPYGLEFMGKEWDRLDADLPQEQVWKGRHGQGGSSVTDDDTKPSSRHHVALGAQRSRFRRCTTCGKRQFSGSPCTCDEPTWVYETPDGPPSGMVRMQRWHHAWAAEALRVLKPGGHLLAFGGTRTYHRLACALEDAGFEIRDCIAWMYGSGFPKSLDVSKAIDKGAGADREVVGYDESKARPNKQNYAKRTDRQPDTLAAEGWKDNGATMTAPATPDAERWQGWGTALKPAFEPIVVARKPLSERNVAANVLRHGTGALNIDGTRIDSFAESFEDTREVKTNDVYGKFDPADYDGSKGRWPANVTLDETAAAMLDEQTGVTTSPDHPVRQGGGVGYSPGADYTLPRSTGFGVEYGDTGGASRFFYCPKADREERNRGLEGYAIVPTHRYGAGIGEGIDPNAPAMDRNHHPTVKPVELMRWLCRLVTPPAGTVLDPFTGSGTTGIAAMREGFTFVGIEREPDYVEIARARIIGDAPLFNTGAEVPDDGVVPT